MINRKNIVVCVLLTILTCGIYGFYWMTKLTDDSIALSEEEGTQGLKVLLLTVVTLGIYGVYWCYAMDKRLYAIEKKRGIEGSNHTVMYIIFYLLGVVVTLALIQNKVNKLAEV
jgi:cytochrome bd-type quinol oxidase subunit 2